MPASYSHAHSIKLTHWQNALLCSDPIGTASWVAVSEQLKEIKTNDEIKILILDTKEFLRNHLESSSNDVTFYEKSTKKFGRVFLIKRTSLYKVEPILQGKLHFQYSYNSITRVGPQTLFNTPTEIQFTISAFYKNSFIKIIIYQ